jgi:integrase/recombinase XerD
MLPLWVEFFEELQHIRGRSLNTVMAYRRDLELYCEFLETKQATSALFDFSKKKKLSSRSQARLVSSIRTYLKFCESRDLKCPELRELRQPKVKTSLPKPINLEQFKALYKAAIEEDMLFTKRNQITLALLFGLGCRVTELIELNINDINEIDHWIKIKGKAGKERLVPINDYLINSLKSYLLEVRPIIIRVRGEQGDRDTLVVNDRGHRPSRVDIWRWLSSWSAKAGFDKPISPHQFRHGYATALLDAGADLRSIQMLLGHTSIQTTQIYTTVSTSHLRKTVDKCHPLSVNTDLQNDQFHDKEIE